MDTSLLDLRLSRDNAREVASRTKEDEDWRTCRTIRNRYNKELVKAKTEHYRKKFLKYEKEHDVKQIYRETKKI